MEIVFIYIVFAVFFMIPVLGIGVSILFVIQWGFRYYKLNQLNYPDKLVKILKVKLNNGKTTWVLDKFRLERFIFISVFSAAVISLGSTFGFVYFFWQYVFISVGKLPLLFYCIITISIFIYWSTIISLGFGRKLKSSIYERIEPENNKANPLLEKTATLSRKVFQEEYNS
ncbi:MAG: hypothetical protein LRZ99_05530 [Desulfotomaculum sp.]|nr:hypothetical protein [Desulfotomaculum sp.]